MLDIMYEIPKDDNIGEVVITKEYIEEPVGTGNNVERSGSTKASIIHFTYSFIT